MAKFKATKKDTSWRDKAKRNSQFKANGPAIARISFRVLNFLDDNNRSQQWLADQMGVTKQYISQVLKGRVNPSLKWIERLQDVLGIKLIDVFSDDSCRLPSKEYIYVTIDASYKRLIPGGVRHMGISELVEIGSMLSPHLPKEAGYVVGFDLKDPKTTLKYNHRKLTHECYS